MSDDMKEEFDRLLSECYIDCPECEIIEDDQYTCTTCWGQGGGGQISVGGLFKMQTEKIQELQCKVEMLNKRFEP